MNDLIKQFKGASATTQLIVVLMVGVLIYFGWKYIKGKGAAVSHFINNQSQQSVLANNGITTSLLNNDYESIADSMYEAMDGPGTDSTIIMGGFEQMQNDADILALKKAFGLRDSSYNPFDSAVDLNTWIMGDLGLDEREQLNSLLSSKGITIKF